MIQVALGREDNQPKHTVSALPGQADGTQNDLTESRFAYTMTVGFFLDGNLLR